MALIKYQDFAQTTTGDALRNVSVTVKTYPGNVQLSLWADSAGTVPRLNPVTTDDNGLYWFYVPGGRYTLIIAGAGVTPLVLTDVIVCADPATGGGGGGGGGSGNRGTTTITGLVFNDPAFADANCALINAACAAFADGDYGYVSLPAGGGQSLHIGDPGITINTNKVGLFDGQDVQMYCAAMTSATTIAMQIVGSSQDKEKDTTVLQNFRLETDGRPSELHTQDGIVLGLNSCRTMLRNVQVRQFKKNIVHRGPNCYLVQFRDVHSLRCQQWGFLVEDVDSNSGERFSWIGGIISDGTGQTPAGASIGGDNATWDGFFSHVSIDNNGGNLYGNGVPIFRASRGRWHFDNCHFEERYEFEPWFIGNSIGSTGTNGTLTITNCYFIQPGVLAASGITGYFSLTDRWTVILDNPYMINMRPASNVLVVPRLNNAGTPVLTWPNFKMKNWSWTGGTGASGRTSTLCYDITDTDSARQFNNMYDPLFELAGLNDSDPELTVFYDDIRIVQDNLPLTSTTSSSTMGLFVTNATAFEGTQCLRVGLIGGVVGSRAFSIIKPVVPGRQYVFNCVYKISAGGTGLFNVNPGWRASLDMARARETVYRKAVTFDNVLLPAGSYGSLLATVTVPGAAKGDTVEIYNRGPTTSGFDAAGVQFFGNVTATGTVKIYALNLAAASVNLASSTYEIVVSHPVNYHIDGGNPGAELPVATFTPSDAAWRFINLPQQQPWLAPEWAAFLELRFELQLIDAAAGSLYLDAMLLQTWSY